MIPWEWLTVAVVLQQPESLHAQPKPRLETRMRSANLRSFIGFGGNGETNVRDSCGKYPASEAAQNATAKCQLCYICVTFSVFSSPL